ncbi:hypothetical protein XELAEV_18026054mg [Xenopus laevis]|uniref:Uncharacterized protein n=1 Tax=Xenopus laevis TaxID=8355 RepID=A0A974HIX6_XENLA|nr:hypothetical protein XELAEV_18026054mg [Xenopus laevis]
MPRLPFLSHSRLSAIFAAQQLSQCPTLPLSVRPSRFSSESAVPERYLHVPQRRYYPAPRLQSDSQAPRHKSHHARLEHHHYA